MNGGWFSEARTFKHCRPAQRMKTCDVYTDKMHQLGFGICSPVFVQCIGVAFQKMKVTGHVADGCIHPYIKVLARCIGNFKSPVGLVAGYIPVFQSAFKPFLNFVSHLRLQVFTARPFAQHGIKVIDFKKVLL